MNSSWVNRLPRSIAADKRRWLVLLALAFLPALLLLRQMPADAGGAAVVPPQRLAIYYGWPSLVNRSYGDPGRAAAVFANFDLVVFGDGLEHSTHSDHAKTQTIIELLARQGVEVYGYVDMGVTTQNLPLATARSYVNEWRAMGVTGIFWDDAGFDMGVDRSRQTALMDYTHSQGLVAFVNAWNPADVFAPANLRPSPLARGDLYLAESWLVGQGYFMDLAAWAAKADALATYAAQTGVRIAAVSSGRTDGNLTALDHPGQMAWWGAAMYNLDAFGYADGLYSASGCGANEVIILPWPEQSYGAVFTEDAVTHGGQNTLHRRSTDLGALVVTGDGRTWGIGYFQSGDTPISTPSATATAIPIPIPSPSATPTVVTTPTPSPSPVLLLYGSIYLDHDVDGQRDTSEVKGIGGVPVTVNDPKTKKTFTAASDGGGGFVWDVPAPGAYLVSVPLAWGGMRRTSSAPVEVVVTMTGAAEANGVTANRIDFGYAVPTGVLMADLAARRTPAGVLLEWRAVEAAGEAFVVWRAERADGPYDAISGLIPALGGTGMTPYAWLDAGARPEQRYWYRVQRLPCGERVGPVWPAGQDFVNLLPLLNTAR